MFCPEKEDEVGKDMTLTPGDVDGDGSAVVAYEVVEPCSSRMSPAKDDSRAGEVHRKTVLTLSAPPSFGIVFAPGNDCLCSEPPLRPARSSGEALRVA